MTSTELDIAIVHHLPQAGGSARILFEYLRQRPQHTFTVYTRMPEPDPQAVLVALPERVRVLRFPLPEPSSRVARMRALLALPARGRELAARVDAAGHEVAFVFPSALVQAHEVLPHLRTPTLAYAPEALRSAYEPRLPFGRPRGLRARLVTAGLDPYETLRKRLDRAHIRAAHQVVTHSVFTAEQLRRIYGVEATIVGLGIDAQVFAVGPERPRTRSVLSVGALHPLKGHQFVIEALAALPAAQRPDLVVVGDRGESAPALRALARERGVELDLRQAIDFSELVGCYRTAGVLACGQVREPFGLITLEAMAAGTPVVAVAEGGFLETVRDGVTGLLVPRDVRAFGEALVRVLDNPAVANRLRIAAAGEVRERWSGERMAQGFDTLLAELAAHGPRARHEAELH